MANPNTLYQIDEIDSILSTVNQRMSNIPGAQNDFFRHQSNEGVYIPGYYSPYRPMPADAIPRQLPPTQMPSNSATPRSAAHYAAEIMMEGDMPRERRRSRYSDRSASSYQRSRATNPFESHETHSVSSYSSAPSHDGPQPAHMQQHPPIPDPGAGPRIIPCELEPVTGCPERFHLHNIDGWTQHVVADHMDGMYPQTSQCWFCDTEFPARTNDFQQRQTAFLERMRHIHGHLASEGTASGRRPDFVLMRFFHAIGAISHEQHESAKDRLAEIRAPREWRTPRQRTRPPVTIIVENPNGRQVRSQR